MNIVLAIAALLLEGSAGAGPLPPSASASCQTYTRASPAAADAVRAWLAHSRDDHVRVCTPAEPQAAGGGSSPLYSGESAVSKVGGVCRYGTHVLTLTAAGGKRRLQRVDPAEAVGMVAVGAGSCPAPHGIGTAQRYTMTYDLSADTFESLMAFWAAAAMSTTAFDRDLACCASGAAVTPPRAETVSARAAHVRLRGAIAAGHMQAAAVVRIVRVPGRGLHRRYALFIADPDAQPPGATLYVIYVSRPLLGAWHINEVTDAPG